MKEYRTIVERAGMRESYILKAVNLRSAERKASKLAKELKAVVISVDIKG